MTDRGATGGSSEPPDAASRRLFFALWPPPELAGALAAAGRRLAPPGTGRPQRADQLHVTVAFLGSVPEAQLPAVLQVGRAAAAVGRPCEVRFDGLEHWRRPQVLCLVARETPPEIVALVQALRIGLAACGIDTETREFKVHLTLARKVRRPLCEVHADPIGWLVGDLTLVESVATPEGSRYEPLASWPLGS